MWAQTGWSLCFREDGATPAASVGHLPAAGVAERKEQVASSPIHITAAPGSLVTSSPLTSGPVPEYSLQLVATKLQARRWRFFSCFSLCELSKQTACKLLAAGIQHPRWAIYFLRHMMPSWPITNLWYNLSWWDLSLFNLLIKQILTQCNREANSKANTTRNSQHHFGFSHISDN